VVKVFVEQHRGIDIGNDDMRRCAAGTIGKLDRIVSHGFT
jgi:hypothetical protein